MHAPYSSSTGGLGTLGEGDPKWVIAIDEALQQEIELRNKAIAEALAIESAARNEAVLEAAKQAAAVEEEGLTSFREKLQAMATAQSAPEAVESRKNFFQDALISFIWTSA